MPNSSFDLVTGHFFASVIRYFMVFVMRLGNLQCIIFCKLLVLCMVCSLNSLEPMV